MPPPAAKKRRRNVDSDDNSGDDGDDTLSRALQDLPGLLTRRERELKAREEQLTTDRLAFETEKAAFGREAQDDDDDDDAVDRRDRILSLNVGGTRLDVLRRTLTAVEGSMLAARFSGRWDDSLERDAGGRFFLDQSPDLFGRLVDALRDRHNATPAAPTPRPPDATQFDHRAAYEAFVRLVHYFGVTHAIWPCRNRYKYNHHHHRHHPGERPDGDGEERGHETGAYVCPPTYHPNVQVVAPATLLHQITPSKHNRYPRAIEITLLDYSVVHRPHADTFNVGWTFRANSNNNNNNANNGGGGDRADHCVTVDTTRGMLKLDGEDVIRVNDGVLPLPTGDGGDDNNDRVVVRMEVKRSVFTFYWNGTNIASCTAFRSRGVKRPTPVVVGRGRWRITELALDA